MTVHQDWRSTAFALPPLAAHTGPFPQRRWLENWWNNRGAGELIIADNGNSLVALVLNDDLLEFAGEPDLTDYHSPLGDEDIAALSEVVTGLPTGTRIQLDSLPGEAAAAVAAVLTKAGLSVRSEQHTVSAIVDLPETYDEYLAGLSKKERHELRRKRRRFDNELGISAVERRCGEGAVELFADLHRRSAGDKGSFMTAKMQQFFLALHEQAGGVIDVLVDGAGTAAAAVFSFEDDETLYLYNSAFEPEVGQLSPGNVILAHLIEKTIASGRRRFDFLKGDEPYKFKLGAVPRPLYRVTTMVGS